MSDTAAELPVLVGPGQDEPETLLLIAKPDAAGHVKMRRWSAADWSATPATHEMQATTLFEWFEDARRHNRTMNQSLTLLRTWLLP